MSIPPIHTPVIDVLGLDLVAAGKCPKIVSSLDRMGYSVVQADNTGPSRDASVEAPAPKPLGFDF